MIDTITLALDALPERRRFPSDFEAVSWLIDRNQSLKLALHSLILTAREVRPENTPEFMEHLEQRPAESVAVLAEAPRLEVTMPETTPETTPLPLTAEEAVFLSHSLEVIACLAKDEEYQHAMRLLEKLAEMVPEGSR